MGVTDGDGPRDPPDDSVREEVFPLLCPPFPTPYDTFRRHPLPRCDHPDLLQPWVRRTDYDTCTLLTVETKDSKTVGSDLVSVYVDSPV